MYQYVSILLTMSSWVFWYLLQAQLFSWPSPVLFLPLGLHLHNPRSSFFSTESIQCPKLINGVLPLLKCAFTDVKYNYTSIRDELLRVSEYVNYFTQSKFHPVSTLTHFEQNTKSKKKMKKRYSKTVSCVTMCFCLIRKCSHYISFISKERMFQGHWTKNQDPPFMKCLDFKGLVEIYLQSFLHHIIRQGILFI